MDITESLDDILFGVDAASRIARSTTSGAEAVGGLGNDLTPLD